VVIRKTLSDLAERVGGRVVGDGSVVIHKVSAIDEAGPGEITFLTNPRYQKYLFQCKASAVIVAVETAKTARERGALNLLEVADPYVAFATLLQLFNPPSGFSREVSAHAHVDNTAVVENGVTVFPNAYVGARAKIAAGSVLYPGVFVGDDVAIGAACVLHANVVVREGCLIGNRVTLHAGVVVGSDGFGYAGAGAGRIKIPQIGIVAIEDDVEIGANTTIDRATLGKTVIRRGAKIDNLVQIAHNVVVGEDSVIAAQAGIAGSTRLGSNVTLAGQVGVVNHIEIGDGATIGPQSGIPKSVPPGAILSGGIAAAPHHEWLKVMTLLPQLPALWTAVRRLEKQMARLLKGGAEENDRDAGR
jgi:UDP-3-O-[3-hydroxymyristoyl] glucosamine N-acyltransferase